MSLNLDNPTDLSDVRRLLRNGTHAEHVRLNQHPLLAGLTRSGYALATYRVVLTAYFHFYRALEAAIDQALAAGLSRFTYAPRRKLPWLASDLAYFGIDPESEGLSSSILQPALALTDEGRLLGALYTIEGSSLGGQVISRHLAAHHALSPDKGARFFYGYGDQTMPLWQQFDSFINAALTHEAVRQRALQAARTTFATMEAVLDEYLARSQPASRP